MFVFHPIAARQRPGQPIWPLRADAAAVMGDVCPHAAISQKTGVGFSRGDPAP